MDEDEEGKHFTKEVHSPNYKQKCRVFAFHVILIILNQFASDAEGKIW